MTATARLVAVAVVGAAALVGVCALGDLRAPSAVPWLVLGLGAAWVAAGAAAARRPPARTAAVVVLGAGLVVRLALVGVPLTTSTDAYRYLWDGRVAAAGIDPYRHAPNAPQLAHLRDAEVWPRINRPGARTIYPPVAQVAFRVTSAAGLRSPAAWKALLVLVEAASLAVLAWLVRRRGGHARDLVLYAWNPVPIIAFGLGGHLDALVVLALLLAAVAWRAGRTAACGVALGVAAGLKLYPLLLLPAFARGPDGRWRWRRALLLSGTAVGVLATAYAPAALRSGGAVLGFLTTGYLQEEGYDSGRRFQLLAALGVDGRVWAPVLGALVAALVLRSRAPAAARAAWLLGGALVLTTPLPWYAAPLVALAAAGGGGWVWAAFPWPLYAAYLTSFHHVLRDLLGDAPKPPLRTTAAAAVVLLALAAPVWPWARAAVLGAAAGGRRRSADPVGRGVEEGRVDQLPDPLLERDGGREAEDLAGAGR
jgi:hypothetical protein